MNLTALDIVALARSGFNAEQISLLNKSILEMPADVLKIKIISCKIIMRVYIY